MCYTNVVFKQNVGRTVNRDQVEKQRIDDRGNIYLYSQSAFRQDSKLLVILSLNLHKIPH